MTEYTTVFGSLDNYEKGGVDVINDDPKYYAFSNMFEVAANAKPYEKVAVGKNLEYVLEVIRAEGTSEWRATPHDEFALVMDGTLRIELLDPLGGERNIQSKLPGLAEKFGNGGADEILALVHKQMDRVPTVKWSAQDVTQDRGVQ